MIGGEEECCHLVSRGEIAGPGASIAKDVFLLTFGGVGWRGALAMSVREDILTQ